jgi:signal transduction histidine kinase
VAERTAELTRTLHQLKESEAQLVQTEKMSSLGQLVAGVAHEINTPLAYVKSNVSSLRERVPEVREAILRAGALLALLKKEAPAPEELERAFADLSVHLERVHAEKVLDDLDALTHDGLHGIEQISELVANLRSFSRLDRSRIASFNVNDSVNAAFLIARPLLRKVDVDKHLGDLPAITCSPSQVNQVVLNLVTNSVQALDKPRGRIVATTRREDVDAVAIEIADNGRGIPAESLTRIFDPFFTTKAPGSGTGLGLSIAYKIVAQHGGRIDVRSRPGEGSTFTVVLPINPPPEALEAGAHLAAEATAR